MNSPTVPVSSSSKKTTHWVGLTPYLQLLSFHFSSSVGSGSGPGGLTHKPSLVTTVPVLPWLSTTFPSSSSCVFFPQFLQSLTVSFKSFLPHFYLPSRQLQSRLQTACQCSQFSKLAGHCPALKPSRNYTHPHPEEERKSIQLLPPSPGMLLWAFLAISSDFPVSFCPLSLLIP